MCGVEIRELLPPPKKNLFQDSEGPVFQGVREKYLILEFCGINKTVEFAKH